jgi:hypothetical protein
MEAPERAINVATAMMHVSTFFILSSFGRMPIRLTTESEFRKCTTPNTLTRNQRELRQGILYHKVA